MEIGVPTLSAEGIVTDIRKKADMLMAHYFASNASQSTVFYGKITSLAYQVQRFGDSAEELGRQIQSELQTYLAKHFDSATVEVDVTEPIAETPGRYNIKLDAVVTQNNLRYSLGNLIEVQNNKITNILNYLQTGQKS